MGLDVWGTLYVGFEVSEPKDILESQHFKRLAEQILKDEQWGTGSTVDHVREAITSPESSAEIAFHELKDRTIFGIAIAQTDGHKYPESKLVREVDQNEMKTELFRLRRYVKILDLQKTKVKVFLALLRST